MLVGVTFAAAWTLFFQPLTTSPSPRIMASKPDLATSAGSSFACCPTLGVQHLRPGETLGRGSPIRHVTITPVSLVPA
jgi:hypothetical protein